MKVQKIVALRLAIHIMIMLMNNGDDAHVKRMMSAIVSYSCKENTKAR